jgi:hypothetical protein
MSDNEAPIKATSGGWFFPLFIAAKLAGPCAAWSWWWLLAPSRSGADGDYQVRDQAMTTTLIVIVTVHDTEVSRFETVLSSKESIAFKYKGFEHVQQDGDFDNI